MRFLFRLLVTLVLVAMLVGLGYAIFREDDQDAVTRIVGSDGQETIIVRDDTSHFFPLGLVLLPFVFLLTAGLLFSGMGRRCGVRPTNSKPGTSSAWMDDWHRRAHEGEARAPAGQEP